MTPIYISVLRNIDGGMNVQKFKREEKKGREKNYSSKKKKEKKVNYECLIRHLFEFEELSVFK